MGTDLAKRGDIGKGGVPISRFGEQARWLIPALGLRQSISHLVEVGRLRAWQKRCQNQFPSE